MIDATQLPRLPTRASPDANAPVFAAPPVATLPEQAKRMELKAGRYYAVNEEK